MKSRSELIRFFLTTILSLVALVYTFAKEPSSINLVGSTPADSLITSQLSIQPGTKIDFIHWNLVLKNQTIFILNITFGESKPNTLGFLEGGQSKHFTGKYTISKIGNKTIFCLTSGELKISLLKLHDNLYHLLKENNELMIGNGGWSYTLNNKNAFKLNDTLPYLITQENIKEETSVKVIYDGRTPCKEFADEHKIKVSDDCFKLKWKLTLHRDSVTFAPTIYSIRKVEDNVLKEITGNWVIIKGTKKNPCATLFQLDPNKPDQSISLFVADDNILLFLHKDESFFVGNEHFSFTLNKRANEL
jgi:hypothetical protein